MTEKPQKVEVSGGTFWLGLMAFIVAIQCCEIRDDVRDIKEEVILMSIKQNARGGVEE